MPNTYLAKNEFMFVSRVIFSGIILRPHVDQVVIGTPWPADSHMMMQLCRHYWEVKNLQQWAYLLAILTISYLVGQHTVKLRLRRIRCAADIDAIYARKWDLGAQGLSGKNNSWQPPVDGRLRTEHEVSEGSLALADDKRPEATLLIGLS